MSGPVASVVSTLVCEECAGSEFGEASSSTPRSSYLFRLCGQFARVAHLKDHEGTECRNRNDDERLHQRGGELIGRAWTLLPHTLRDGRKDGVVHLRTESARVRHSKAAYESEASPRFVVVVVGTMYGASVS